MRTRYLDIILVSAMCWMCASCSTTRYVPEGDFLYKGASVKVKGKEVKESEEKRLSEELESILRPRPNRRFLGIPIRLLIYNFWGTPGEEKGLGNWISRKAGEPPVLFSQVPLDFQKQIILNRMENRGYFQATLERDSTMTKKKIKFKYTVDPGRQYLIDTTYFPTDTSVLGIAIRATEEQSFLKSGHPFDLDVIKAERERINARLKEHGFYYFSPDDLLVLVDSTNAPYVVSLSVRVKESISPRAEEKYTIDSIFVYPSFSGRDRDTARIRAARTTPTGLTIVDADSTYKPRVFEKTLFFRPGDLYNRTDHNRSINKLIDLGAFKYVENRFLETGGHELDVYYYLTPYKKKSLRFELTGRNTSTNFAGAEANVSWQNRNAFRGAERLRFNVYGGTDFQISGINKGNDLYRFGAEASLSIPRFITPFSVVTPRAFIPRTNISLGFDKLNRVNSYVLNSFRTSFGYHWRETTQKEHQFTIFSVNYIQPAKITPEYQAQIDEDPSLANAIRRQFTIGPSYNYTVTNTADNIKHSYYLNLNFDFSGNLIGLLSGANFETGETRRIFDAEYSQYLKGDIDLRYYNDLGRGDQFAARFFTGIGFAYGNSRALPFFKQYFAGGTTGLRAFRARSLGPGTFRADNVGQSGVIAADQTADIKLEANVEYRPKISGILNGAIFVDAGNIWLLRTDPERPGAKFEFSDFLAEFAVDFGVGLRFDFSFFVLRTDLAFPIRKPWRDAGDRWVIDEIDLGSPTWRRENLVFNLAIGYPF